MTLTTQSGTKVRILPGEGFAISATEDNEKTPAVITLRYDWDDDGDHVVEVGRYKDKYRALSVVHRIFVHLYDMRTTYAVPSDKAKRAQGAA